LIFLWNFSEVKDLETAMLSGLYYFPDKIKKAPTYKRSGLLLLYLQTLGL